MYWSLSEGQINSNPLNHLSSEPTDTAKVLAVREPNTPFIVIKTRVKDKAGASRY